MISKEHDQTRAPKPLPAEIKRWRLQEWFSNISVQVESYWYHNIICWNISRWHSEAQIFEIRGFRSDLKFKVHCGSALGPGASGLPYYCTPPVTVPGVLGGLAVWRHNNNKTKIHTCHYVRVLETGGISSWVPWNGQGRELASWQVLFLSFFLSVIAKGIPRIYRDHLTLEVLTVSFQWKLSSQSHHK